MPSLNQQLSQNGSGSHLARWFVIAVLVAAAVIGVCSSWSTEAAARPPATRVFVPRQRVRRIRTPRCRGTYRLREVRRKGESE